MYQNIDDFTLLNLVILAENLYGKSRLIGGYIC